MEWFKQPTASLNILNFVCIFMSNKTKSIMCTASKVNQNETKITQYVYPILKWKNAFLISVVPDNVYHCNYSY